MIRGIGIDSIEIERFTTWHQYARTTLERVFSQEEIDYCMHQPNKSAERFAVRFAAREAFFKALCIMNPDHTIPFLRICKMISINKQGTQLPHLLVDWDNLAANQDDNKIRSFASLTHTRTTATALVILEFESRK